MPIHFTDAELKSLASPAKGKLSKHLDTECPGLMLKVNPTGKKYFYIRKKVEGKTREVKIGEFGRSDKGLMNSRAARREYHKLLNVMEKGLSKIVAERRRDKQNDYLTIVDLITTYMERYAKARVTPSTFTLYKSHCKRFEETPLSKIPLKLVERTHCIALFESLRDGGIKKGTLKATFGLASRALQWGIDEQVLPEIYDCFRFICKRRIATMKKHKRDDYCLTDQELRDCWFFLGWKGTVNSEKSKKKHLKIKPDPIKALEGSTILRLLILTGLRKSEVIESKWEEWEHFIVVQEEQSRSRMPCLIIEENKTQTKYFVPLLPPVRELLAQYKTLRGETDSPFVFPELATSDSNALRANVQKTNKVSHTLHDIRRTVATRLGDMGYSDVEIDRIMNHARRGVTAEHYHHANYLVPKYKMYQEWIEELQRVLYPAESKASEVLPEFSLDNGKPSLDVPVLALSA